jgi:hypothetical protein
MGTNEARSGKNPRQSRQSQLGIMRDLERVLEETLHNRIFHEIHWSLAGRSKERNPLQKIGESTAAITSGGQMEIGERKCLSKCPPLTWPDQLEGLRPLSLKGLS